ncbi:MAG TPA: hypothetical protein VMU80_25800 [Bryobacteraceae bacterium]|nr:hypothetical protein [Bryobacteraceae bacterium]
MDGESWLEATRGCIVLAGQVTVQRIGRRGRLRATQLRNEQ